MAIGTGIEWTEATWNPATGCDKVSPGCKNCYAETLSARLQKMGQEKYKNNFVYTEHPKDIETPLKWKKPKMIFVNSMSDLFHEKATEHFIWAVFETMLKANHHTYQILTKRPERMKKFVQNFTFNKQLKLLPNHIWLGVSVENQHYTDRIDILREVKCQIRFVSFEPLLGEIYPKLRDINWVIVGGESGTNARPMEEDWVKNIRYACRITNTAFFFKQWGGRYPKEKGNLLDGKQYLEFPKVHND